MNPDELTAYFNVHVFYEIEMLRGTLERCQNCGDDITRNALLESCGMHARNLSDFLRSKSKKGRNTVLASKYNPKFQDRRPPNTNGAFQRMNSGMHHLGTARAKGDKKKFTLNDAIAIREWIEKDFKRFLDELPEHYKSRIDRESHASPPTFATVADDPTPPTATNTMVPNTADFARSKNT